MHFERREDQEESKGDGRLLVPRDGDTAEARGAFADEHERLIQHDDDPMLANEELRQQ